MTFISIRKSLWLVAMVVMVLSCSKELNSPDEFQNEASGNRPDAEVTVEFNILSPDSVRATKAGAEEGYASTTERKINTLHLFAADYDPETGKETMEASVQVELTSADYTSKGVKAQHTFNLKAGTKRFYAGANMTDEHASAFVNGKTMTAGSYESALDLVMDNFQNNAGNGSNILMLSSPATDKYGTDIDINMSSTIHLTAELKRLVSKVMVVAEYTGIKNNAEGRTGESINYIENELGFFFDMQFILNNTNKALHIAEVHDGNETYNADPNWLMSQMVEKGVNGAIMYRKMWDCVSNFSYWDETDVKERLKSTENWWCSNILSSKNEAGYLGKGLYCLENTVFDDYSSAAGLSQQEKTEAAYLTTTHVYIKARFSPKKVYGWSGEEVEKTGTQAISDMYWVTESENGSQNYTFFRHKTNLGFFTWTGANKWITGGRATWDDFEPYLGGWVYFKTFFEGDKAETNGLIYKDNCWGIRRNDYCVLTIEKISDLGTSTAGDAAIKVKTTTLPWVKRGNSEITVSPE